MISHPRGESTEAEQLNQLTHINSDNHIVSSFVNSRVEVGITTEIRNNHGSPEKIEGSEVR